MSNEPDHITGDSGEKDNRRKEGPLHKAVSAIIGSSGGDGADPKPVRGWEQPLEEQQGEPENEPKSQA